jgi:hypothetical protein
MIGNGLNGADRSVATVTYNGDSCSLIKAQEPPTNWSHVEIWGRNNPDIVTGNVVTTFNVSQSQLTASGISFIDADATNGAGFGAAASTANPSVTVTDSANGDIVVGVLFSDTGPVATTTEDGTLIGEDENINADSDSNRQRFTATGANQVVSWTCSDTTNEWAIAAVAIKSGVVGSTIFDEDAGWITTIQAAN